MPQLSRQLPCDGDGVCMVCRTKPGKDERLICQICFTPWHKCCISSDFETLSATLQWNCPDCTGTTTDGGSATPSDPKFFGIVASIRAIEDDPSLTDREKAFRRQQLMSGGEVSEKGKRIEEDNENDIFGNRLNCSICMELPDQPVTTQCGHNFCLKCFQKWVGQGKHTCANCRSPISRQMAENPRINAALVLAIQAARMTKTDRDMDQNKTRQFINNQDRADISYTIERSKRVPRKANAASQNFFVTIQRDHFGPILAENDAERGRGVLVGDCYEDRLECRQWGVHFPHVGEIGGQKKHGAQSVVLSGGYEDDEDHGEWFLYTVSGGRDTNGNIQTHTEQSFDQRLESSNGALQLSCKRGYPIRVVRSYTYTSSSYAPSKKGLRYDGIYLIEKCWQKVGKEGFKICRYLFVRCDNSPAPWASSSVEHGDRVRALPVISELEEATNVTEKTKSPSWDFDEEEGCWKWNKPPPASKLRQISCSPDRKNVRIARRKVQKSSLTEIILKGLSCLLCYKLMTMPVTTPCGHNFCKSCLECAFAGQACVRERLCFSGQSLRSKKNVMKCPSCPADLSEFLNDPQVNREVMDVIEVIQNIEKDEDSAKASLTEKMSISSSGAKDVPEMKKNISSLITDGKSGRVNKQPEMTDGADGLTMFEANSNEEAIEAMVNVCCDNTPSPWSSDEHGDRVRDSSLIPELEEKKPPPASKLMETSSVDIKNVKARIPKGLSCLLCAKLMSMPVTPPCGHNFCQHCLENAFAGKTFVRERLCLTGQSLRSKKNVMKCPSCPVDISEFLSNPQVNRKLMDVIEAVQKNEKEEAIVKVSAEAIHTEKLPFSSSGVGIERNWQNNDTEESEGVNKRQKTDVSGGLTMLHATKNEEPEEALYNVCSNNTPAQMSDGHGDGVRALPVIPELEVASNTTKRSESMSWNYDEEEDCWIMKTPPHARKLVRTSCSLDRKKVKKARVLKGLSCLLCAKIMNMPVVTPCGHKFCQRCLEHHFTGQTRVRERLCLSGQSLRSKKNVMKCPSCPADISEFLSNPQVNRKLVDVIEELQKKEKDMEASVKDSAQAGLTETTPFSSSGFEYEPFGKNNDSVLVTDEKSERVHKRLKFDDLDGLAMFTVKESDEANEGIDDATPSTQMSISSEHGDRVRGLPAIPGHKETTKRKESPSQGYDEEESCWILKKPLAASKLTGTSSSLDGNKVRKAKILKGLSCLLCLKVMTIPVTTPCSHNFCRSCLEDAFSGKSYVRERLCLSGQSLRLKKNEMKCPSCTVDISGFLRNPQVNQVLMDVIESLQENEEVEVVDMDAANLALAETMEEVEVVDMDAANLALAETMPGSSFVVEENDLSNPLAADGPNGQKNDRTLIKDEESERVNRRQKIDGTD